MTRLLAVTSEIRPQIGDFGQLLGNRSHRDCLGLSIRGNEGRASRGRPHSVAVNLREEREPLGTAGRAAATASLPTVSLSAGVNRRAGSVSATSRSSV